MEQQSGLILETLTPAQGTSIIPLYTGDKQNRVAFENLTFSGKITSLNLNAYIKTSSPQGDYIPSFYDNYARFQGIPEIQNQINLGNKLFIHLQKSMFMPWIKIGEIPLINNKNTEYSLINLLHFYPLDYFQNQGRLGISVEKTLLSADKIIFWGGYLETFTPKYNIFSNAYVNNITINETSKIVLQSNTNRKQITLFNKGDKTLYIALGFHASLENYSYPLPPKFLLQENHNGLVSAICPTNENSILQVTETTI